MLSALGICHLTLSRTLRFLHLISVPRGGESFSSYYSVDGDPDAISLDSSFSSSSNSACSDSCCSKPSYLEAVIVIVSSLSSNLMGRGGECFFRLGFLFCFLSKVPPPRN